MISIHAAREGGDSCGVNGADAGGISIHAAREGGDVSFTYSAPNRTDFNPRRP